MAFLLAAFGDGGPVDWTGLVQEIRDDGGWRVSERRESDGSVRLAALDAPQAAFSSTHASGSLLAIAVGRLEGEGDRALIVLEAYRQKGIGGLAHLRGEFAYALWDRRLRSLFVGCDAVGLRAPAYSWNGRTFLVSTRALALLRQPGVPKIWDQVYVAHALIGAWSRTAVSTAFDGVRRMAGGEILHVTAQGPERLLGARLAFSAPDTRSRSAAASALGMRIDEAVRENSQRGSPCVALSGGLDSCVVATSLAKGQPVLDAFSLVAPDGSPGDGRSLAALVAEFPGMRHRQIQAGETADVLPFGPLADDPICAAPLLQPGRVALLLALRDMGFRHVFDGEGGDEIFDIAWSSADLIGGAAFSSVMVALASHGSRGRLFRDFVLSFRGPASNLLLERLKRRVRARRPWLRAAFWESPGLSGAWNEVAALAWRSNARTRLPEVLGAYGRYWRAQDLVRQTLGVESSSPMLHRAIVEFVGSVRPGVAIDPRHGKALLRHLAAQRVPPAIAWRPKTEPLNDWLIARWISQDANIARAVSRIRNSRLLADIVDTPVLIAVVDQARRTRGPTLWASAVAELGAFVEWVTAVEERFGL